MSEVKFHKLDNSPIRAKRLTDTQFRERSENGLAILFDIEVHVRGFRFLHAANKRFELSYLILHFPNLEGDPIAYELPLKQFHMYVSYYLIQQQIDEGHLEKPEGKPTPLENLYWCMTEMVKNSK